MDRKYIASELLEVAKLVSGASRTPTSALKGGPAGRVMDRYWNVLHDFEDRLDSVVHEYDVAASYRDGKGRQDALKVIKAVKEAKKGLEHVSMKLLDNVFKAENNFVKRYGEPEAYAEAERNKMFPG